MELIAIAKEIKEEADANQDFALGNPVKDENEKEVDYGETSAEDEEDNYEEE